MTLKLLRRNRAKAFEEEAGFRRWHLQLQTEDFLQKEEKLEAWKEAIYAQSLPKSRRKSNGRVLTTKQLEETYQQASKEIESRTRQI